jgi:signal transduction histidine kinase
MSGQRGPTAEPSLAEARSNARLRVLAEAGQILALNVGLDEMLQTIAKLIVPALADWCVVDLLEGRLIRRVATEHRDPEKLERAGRVSARYRPELGDGSAIARVIAEGKAHFYPRLPAALFERAARDEDELALFRSEGLLSVIMVPLMTGGTCIGSLSLTTSDSQRLYDETDLAFGEELGRRVGMAIASARMRRELEEAHERMQRLFTQAPMSIAIYRGPDHVIEFANPTFLQVRSRGLEIIGRTYAEAFPEALPMGKPTLDRAFASGEPMTFPEVQTLLDRGHGPEEAFFHVSFVALKDEKDEIDRLMSVSFEVTDRVLARRALDAERAQAEAARREAEAANRAKDDFLAMLGHELRNPLAPIVTALNLMELRGITGAERERSVIARQVAHLARLVDDLLDVSRIIRGKVELVRTRIELSELVSRALETASPSFEQRNQYVHVTVPRHDMLVLADPARMTQAFANLFTNASKYTEPGGHISVTAEPGENEAVLQIQDDGLGIRADMLDQIFELFVQEQQAIDRARGGLGLGLAIVKSVVTLHGGSVTAKSPGLGHGSTFSVRLPLATSTVPIPLASDAGAQHMNSLPERAARRILVVDDNEDAADMLSMALRAAGHVTELAFDGPSALAALQTFGADVALLDLGLPAMDGYELAAHIKSAYPQIKLIALTGYGQESDRERTRNAGFHGHLVKPITLELVLSAVSR